MLRIDGNTWNETIKGLKAMPKTKIHSPIVDNAVIEYANGVLTLNVTNLSNSIQMFIAYGGGSDNFSVATPIERLKKLTARKGQDVDLEVTPHVDALPTLSIAVGPAKQTLPVVSNEDYPPFIPEVTGYDSYETYNDIGEFTNHLSQVVCAISNEQSRYPLDGIKIESNRMIATDGRRMHIVNLKTPVCESPDYTPCLIHWESANCLIGLEKAFAKNNNQIARTVWNAKQLRVETDRFIFVTTLLEKYFPPVDMILKDREELFLIGCISVKSMVDTLAIQKPTLNPLSGLIRLQAKYGQMRCITPYTIQEYDRTDAVSFDAPIDGDIPKDIDWQCNYNAMFLADMLKSCPTTYVDLYCMDNPSLLYAFGDCGHFNAIIMSMTIREPEDEIPDDDPEEEEEEETTVNIDGYELEKTELDDRYRLVCGNGRIWDICIVKDSWGAVIDIKVESKSGSTLGLRGHGLTIPEAMRDAIYSEQPEVQPESVETTDTTDDEWDDFDMELDDVLSIAEGF